MRILCRFGLFLVALAVVTASPGVLAPSVMATEPGFEVVDNFQADGFDIRQVVLRGGGDTLESPVGAMTRSTRLDLAGSDMVLVDAGGSEVALRARQEDAWGEWITIGSEADEGPDGLEGEEGGSGPTSNVVGPIWVGGADVLEIASSGQQAVAIEIELLTDMGTAEAPRVATQTRGEASALPSQPVILDRSAWTSRGFATDHSGCSDGPVVADDLRGAIVHHTVTTNSYSASQVDDLLRGIYRAHVDIKGWCDIGYNFLIDRFGTIWQGRSGATDDPIVGGHSKGFNTSTVGIALLGQHQSGASPASASPTAASISSLRAILGWKLGLHGIDPLGTALLKNRSSRSPLKFPADTWVEVPAVASHSDVGLTACPGNLLRGSIAPISADLANIRANSEWTPFPKREPYDHGPGIVLVESSGALRAAGSAEQVAGVAVGTPERAIAVDGDESGGQVLTNGGSLLAYGNAKQIGAVVANSAIDVAVGNSTSLGWVLQSNGAITAFGGAPARTATGASSPAVAFNLDRNGNGYVLTSSGALAPVGQAPKVESTSLPGSAIGVAIRSDRVSGWVLDSGGRLHAFGGAPAWQPLSSVSDAQGVIVGTNDAGGWVIDSVGRLTRFGNERPIVPISTSVGYPSVVDGAVVDWVADDSSELIRFVQGLSTLFLGHGFDPAQADLVAVEVTFEGRETVVSELAHSDAWAGALVEEMYRDVLGRGAESDGRAYWVKRLKEGLRTQDLGANFYSSDEYVRSSGSTAGYIARLYDALLDRTPEAEGLAYWVKKIDLGKMTPAQVAFSFYQSIESRLGRVERLYGQILRRTPDSGGHNYWAKQLLTVDDITLAVSLASSSEYYDLVTK